VQFGARACVKKGPKIIVIDPRETELAQKAGPEFGMWKSNANVLTSISPPYDPAMGTYQLRGLLCNVYK